MKSLLIKIKSPELTEKYFQSTLEEEHYSCNSSLNQLFEELKNNADYQILLPIVFNIPTTLYLDIISGEILNKKYHFVFAAIKHVEWHLLLYYIQHYSEMSFFNNDFKIKFFVHEIDKTVKELIIESKSESYNVFFFSKGKYFGMDIVSYSCLKCTTVFFKQECNTNKLDDDIIIAILKNIDYHINEIMMSTIYESSSNFKLVNSCK